jgi:signal transduction histidine kinase
VIAITLQRIRQFARKHLFWVGALAVFVPLIAICTSQFDAFHKLELTLSAYRKMCMRDYLTEVTARASNHFRSESEQLLAMPPAVFTHNRLDLAIRHLDKRPLDGVRTIFLANFLDRGSGVYFYNRTEGVFEERDPNTETVAVNTALAPWEYLSSAGTFTPYYSLAVNETDRLNRIVLKPVTDDNGRIVGAIGIILDEQYFADRLVPDLMKSSLGAFYESTNQGSVNASLYNDRGKLLHSINQNTSQEEDETASFPFVFTDWKVGIHNIGLTPEQFAKRNFFVNLTSSAVVLICLCGGVALTLRTASREVRLSQMKSDFVSNVSHELRTPLASIRVFGEFLKLGKVKSPEKVQEYGRFIESESSRLTQLINNILDFAKIESEKKTYLFQYVSLADLVKEVVEGFRARLVQTDMKVRMEVASDGLPNITADRSAITQVLYNLIDNAVKYSGDSKEVLVRVSRQQDHLAVAVIDQGVGIPVEAQERIFEKFYRVSTGLIHDVKGSGLGLSIVKHIVQAHQGRVSVISKEGDGSTFVLSLPIHRYGEFEEQESGEEAGAWRLHQS